MKYYITMEKSKYQLHNKNNKSNSYNDFITKDVYMILGINFNAIFINPNININMIIVEHLNYLNNISNEIYKTDDFIIVSIANTYVNPNAKPNPNENTNVNPNVNSNDNVNTDDNEKCVENNKNTKITKSINIINNNKISDDITKGFTDINYELFNTKDIIFSFKNKKNNNFTLKYTLVLPVHNVYNMILNICNNSIFKSKLYSIDNDNIEKWNNIPFNEIEYW